MKICEKKSKIKSEIIDLVWNHKALIDYYLSLKLIGNEKNRDYFIKVKNYLKNAK